jgi:hypothetical protein
VAARHDVYLGRPSLATRRQMQSAVHGLYAASTWQEFYDYLRIPFPGEAELARQLRQAVVTSARYKYHTPGQSLAKLGRSGVSRVLLRGGDKYSVPPNLKAVSTS